MGDFHADEADVVGEGLASGEALDFGENALHKLGGLQAGLVGDCGAQPGFAKGFGVRVFRLEESVGEKQDDVCGGDGACVRLKLCGLE